MRYRQLIKKVQDHSGFSDEGTEQLLQLIIETLSSRLQEDKQEDFASQLPGKLQDIALKPMGQERFTKADFYHQLTTGEGIGKNRLKKQLMAVWYALKDTLSPGELNDIKTQLPHDLAAELY